MGFFWMIRRGCCPSTANSNLDALSSTRDTHSTLSEFLLRISDGLLALFIAFLAQLLIAGIQCALDGEGIDFPASILAMAAVFIAFSVAGCAFPGVDGFYQKRLKRATELLNRHMSIGFTVPVIMICRGPVSDGRTIAMVIICFLLTGILNTILAYGLALPLQSLMVRYDKAFAADESSDIEKGEPQQTSELHGSNKSFCDSSMNSSRTTSVYVPSDSPSISPEIHPTSGALKTSTNPSFRRRFWTFALQNPLLLLCWLLTLTVGLPLRYSPATLADAPLATLLLFSLWLSTLTLQSTIKTHGALPPWARTLLSGLANPVLWTSLSMTCYLLLDGALSSRTLQQMLNTLQTHTPLSTLLLHHHPSSTTNNQTTTQTPEKLGVIAAGDIATSILSSGLVAWGLKLFSHRLHIFSRAGLTVCTISSLLALGNVSLGPQLADSLSVVPPSRALAFAARSVTIALADPVMGMVGGDGGLNAAMVVVSGIGYQMGLGFGVGGWMEGRCLMWWGRMKRNDKEGTSEAKDGMKEEGQRHGQTRENDDKEADDSTAQRKKINDPRTVAAGVTVGINAAAMGTAYLYEAQSEAAPHAALAMMALGIMTVVFASIPPIARWVVESVSA